MKKILSVVLALMLVMSVLAFTACEKAPQDLLAEAEQILAEKPVKMTMKMNFQSDNAEIQKIFDMMNIEVPVIIDGENMAMDMSMDVMGQTVVAKMTLVDKVLYYNMELMGQSMKMKANLTDEELVEFMGENSAEMPVDYTQFAELKAENKDGKTVITCTGITDEGKKALNDEMASALEALGGSAEMGELTYTITLKDGKYEAMDLSCAYTVTVSGTSVSTTMSLGVTFSYDNVAAVAAPSDAADYQDMSFGDIMG